MSTAKIVFYDKKELNIEVDYLTSGGEGLCYKSKDGIYLVKKYKNIKQEKKILLEKILVISSNIPEEKLKEITFPIGILTEFDGESTLGAVSYFSEDSLNLEEIMYDSQAVYNSLSKLNFNYSDYVLLARRISEDIIFLHGKGCAHTDLSHRNILIKKENSKYKTILVDLDGIVVEGFLPPNVQGTTGYIAPEILNSNALPNKNTDKHSIAVLIYRTLLFRDPLAPLTNYSEDPYQSDNLAYGKYALFSEHPTNYKNRPEKLSNMNKEQVFVKGFHLSYKIFPPYIQKMFEDAFIKFLFSPEDRPNSKDWYEALSYLADILYKCNKCTQNIPYPYWLDISERHCPICGSELSQPIIVHLYDKSKIRGKGYIKTNHYLPLDEKSFIYEYQISSYTIPNLEREYEKAIAEISYENGYKIINKSKDTWVCNYNNKLSFIKPNESIDYFPNLKIIFSENSKMAQFI